MSVPTGGREGPSGPQLPASKAATRLAPRVARIPMS
jgi:hypothetical protein